jgi:very-short-patch-repair endonuclease
VTPVRRAPVAGDTATALVTGAITHRTATAVELAPVVTAPKESEIERRFAQQIRAAGLPEPEREYYHITGRDFRLDFAWPAIKLGVEVQGMAHRIKSKFHADMEKRILAQMNGWLVMEISGDMVRHDTAIAWLVILMEQRRQQ